MLTFSGEFGDPLPAPPVDPELAPILEQSVAAIRKLSSGDMTPDEMRQATVEFIGAPPDLSAGGKVRVNELTVIGCEGGAELELTVLEPADRKAPLPLIYYIHGGGMVSGERTMSLDLFLPHVIEEAAIVASIEYRLAPEHADPAPITDCYDGLRWCADHSDELGIDPSRIIVAGISAGGGLAAGAALMARDRGYPQLTHQVLSSPMLDDRLTTHSSHMLEGNTIWDRNDNLGGWTALLGDRRGTDAVSPYSAPARASDLSGLPRTYLDAGSVETFRDDVIDYAQRLSQAGVSVDFHLWGGGFHGFDTLADSSLSRASRSSRETFIRDALS